MKKITLFLLALLFILSPLCLVVSGTGAGSGAGMTFTSDTTFPVSRTFASAPHTVLAEIKIDKSFSGRAGVILGNFGGATSCLNFEITTAGAPRLYYVDPDKTTHDLVFSQVDVRTGEWLHIGFVHDSTTKTASVYINGELKQTLPNATEYSDQVIINPFYVGGDHRAGNAQAFKGEIRSLSAYSIPLQESDVNYYKTYFEKDAQGLMAHYELSAGSKTVEDLSGNGYTANFCETWVTNKVPVTDYAYSLCVVGDTQVISEKHPTQLHTIYQWIVDNTQSKKIAHVIGLGDITEKSAAAEWTNAKQAIDKLNGVVPYTLVRGNHDKTDGYNNTFGTSEYKQNFDGFYNESKLESSYRLFEVGQAKYLLITLDYGPTDAELAWASSVIEQHPDRKVIIATHAYLFRDGTTLDKGDVAAPNPNGTNGKNNGDDLWEKLVRKHENILLVLSGHDPCPNVIATQTKGDHGNTVTQMLIDPQGVDKSAIGPLGAVAMLYFSEDGKTLSVEYYSTIQKKYFLTTSQFTLSLGEEEPTQIETEVTATGPAESASETAPEETPKSPVLPIAIGAGAAVIVGGGVATLLLIKKKRK